MSCPKCGNVDTELLFKGNEECSSCNENVISEFFICKSCNFIWKIENGNYKCGMEFTLKNILDVFILFYNNGQASDYINYQTHMEDYIHRCLNCNSLAYQLTPNSYGCNVCGFKWDVI